MPWGVLATGAALVAGCGGEEPATQTLTLTVVTKPGVVEFDKKRLSAGAGRIEFELINERRKGHNIRIHTGDRCCFPPGSSIRTPAPPAAIGAPSKGRWSSDQRRAASVAARFRARRAGRSPL